MKLSEMGSYWTSYGNSKQRQMRKIRRFGRESYATCFSKCEDKQVNYDQQDKSYNKIETPLSIGTSLFLYHFISDLNIRVNYDKVVSIIKDIASSIQEQRDKNNGAFIPTGFVPGKTTFFAIDNGDVKIDTPDGGKQVHDTVIAAYQEKQSTMNGEATVSQYAVFTNLILHTIVLYQTT